MDTIPAAARILLDFIYQTDAGKPRPDCYRVIFDNRQNRLKKPITSMTLDEVIAAGRNWGSKAWVEKHWGSDKASSAAGAGQFMRKTLLGLKREMKLTGAEIFAPELQDRLAMRLLERRGYDDFVAGRIDRTAFALALAQEWASLPVLSPCKGAHRTLKRGQSFYAGDSLNRALVTPQKVEAVLDKVLEAVDPPAPEPRPAPAPQPDLGPQATAQPAPAGKAVRIGGGLLVALAAALAAFWHHVVAFIGGLF